jgi:hypothetical protein
VKVYKILGTPKTKEQTKMRLKFKEKKKNLCNEMKK